jgi:hypothetical protein
MKKEAYFRKSLKRLQSLDPKLACRLLALDFVMPELFQTLKGEQNLKRTYEGQTFYYHSPEDPCGEAESWFVELNTGTATVLYVYGVGLGYYYDAAKDWLKTNPKHALVFLEEDLGVLRRLLETERGYEILTNPQVRLIHFEDPLEDKALFNELAWIYILCNFQISALKLYQEINPEGYLELQNCIEFNSAEKNTFVDEYLHYGVAFFRNFYPNLLELPHASFGNGLFGEFKNIPAVICGAGPSLDKNIERMRTLKEKALFFAGSSALPALISNGLVPHFGVAVDPNGDQVSRIQSADGHNIPFFYRNRLFHDALKAISSPRLYLTGAGGYPIAEWFEKELAIEGEELDEGNNVVNFCIAIAHALGCNPIILAGVDLAFSDGQQYALGVIPYLREHEKKFKEEEIFDLNPLLKEDIYGQPVYTLWKWIIESEWVSLFGKEHPKLTLINATEGGLGFKEIPNMSLEEVEKKYLLKNHPLPSKIKRQLEVHDLSQVTREKISCLLHLFQESLNRCIALLDTLIKEIQKLKEDLKQNRELPTSLETPIAILAEADIQEEAGYEYLLSIFNSVYLHIRERDIREIQFSKRKLSQKNRQKKVLTIQEDRLQFLKDTARVNVELIRLLA